MALLTRLLNLRRDGRILKLPPYLSAFCIIAGLVWLLLLPLDEYSRRTYISENALLPGQVHTYFGGSEHNIFRAYRHEVADLANKPEEQRVARLSEIFRSAGLKVATQKYEYTASGRTISGENVYALLQGPRADATEAIVLVGAWTNMDGEINHSGVALVLTLARYFKRWSLWSKDILFLISGDSTTGPQAWVDAYHSSHLQKSVEPLSLKSGALQGAIALDYPAGPWGHRFDKLHIVYDGINGQLPNLDLFNTVVNIANGQMGLATTLQSMWTHNKKYQDRLQTLFRGMINQGLGYAAGPHSSFIPYHVDAVTLQTVGDGWHDEMTLGRTVESVFRSLNNLLEHLHQSFFFYLLMQTDRFVSIGTYLPSAMLIAANFTITAIALWFQSSLTSENATEPAISSIETQKITSTKEKGASTIAPTPDSKISDQDIFMPVAFVLSIHLFGLVPLYIFNTSSEHSLGSVYHIITGLNIISPYIVAGVLSKTRPITTRETILIRSLSLLLLGMCLSALATLNFSLSLIIGLLSAPLSFIKPTGNRALAVLSGIVLCAVNPMVVLLGLTSWWGNGIGGLLLKAAEGWHVWGLWTQLLFWLVWWPAWSTGAALVGLGLF